MTTDEMRIALAKWAGHDVSWHPLNCPEDNECNIDCVEAYNENMAALPDITDLNVLHEYEKRLTPQQEEVYVEDLKGLIMDDAYEEESRYMKSNLSSCDSTYRATAAQRAEALLRTLGLWKD